MEPPKNTDEIQEVLYVMIGKIQPGIKTEEIKEDLDNFMVYLELIQTSEKFVWGGILSPDKIMVLFEAKNDEESVIIYKKNPFIDKPNLVKFHKPYKWYVMFGY